MLACADGEPSVGDETGVGGTSSSNAELSGSYLVYFDEKTAYLKNGWYTEPQFSVSLADTIRIDFRQTENDLQAVLAAPWQKPRACSAERKASSVNLHCPTSESKGSQFISPDEQLAPWIDLELAIDSNREVSGVVSAKSAFIYPMSDMMLHAEATGTGRARKDDEGPQLRIDDNPYFNSGWLPWQPMRVLASEGLTEDSLTAALPKGDKLIWSIEHAENAPWFGAISALGTATDWSAAGTVVALDPSQSIQDLAGNKGSPQNDSSTIIDLGPAVESYQFDSTVQLVSVGAEAELLTTETGRDLCESGGCVKLEGVVQDCNNWHGAVAGRLLGRAATTLNLRYRLILGDLAATDSRSQVSFNSSFTVEVGAPGINATSRVSSNSARLNVGETTEWQTFSMSIPEKLQGGDLGFAINLYNGDCRAVFYWGGPITVLIDRIELK
jgi:hypothetical protein